MGRPRSKGRVVESARRPCRANMGYGTPPPGRGMWNAVRRRRVRLRANLPRGPGPSPACAAPPRACSWFCFRRAL